MCANYTKNHSVFILKLEYVFNKMFPFPKCEITITTPGFASQKDFYSCYILEYIYETHKVMTCFLPFTVALLSIRQKIT